MDPQDGTFPLPEGYLLPPPPRRIVLAPPEPEGVDPRYAQFSELCAAFSRMMLQDEGGRDEVSPTRAVARNLAVTRAVFAKWSVEIMVVLFAHPEGLGFERLRRDLAGISPRVLSLKLKALEEQGLLDRKVLADRPPRVSYSLTPNGCSFARMAEPIFLYLDSALRGKGTPRDPSDAPEETEEVGSAGQGYP